MAPDTDTPFSSALARVFWIMVGPVLLFLLLFRIVADGGGWFTPADIGFVAVLGGTILARVIEFWGGNPQTGSGEPATRAHLRQFVITTLVVGFGVWVLANLIGNYWLQ